MAEDSQSAAAKETSAVIDRLEDEGWAVLQLSEGASALIELPVGLLPDGAAGGDHLVISIRLDPAASEEAAERIRALQEKLEGRGSGGEFKL